MTAPAPPSLLQRSLRQLRALALTTLALLIILTAMLVGIGRALSPHADRLRPWLETLASERIGQQVTLERVEAEWPRLTPSLSLIGAQIDDGAGNRLSVDRARLEIHLANALDREANLVRLILLGLELILEPDEEGRWGAQLGAGATGDWRQQTLPGDLLVRDVTVRVRPLQWPEIRLHLEEGSLERRGRQTQFRGALAWPGVDERFELRLLIDQSEGIWNRVRGWLAMRDLRLQDVLSYGDASAGLPAEMIGRIDLEAWLDWQLPEGDLALDLDWRAQADAWHVPIQGQAWLAAGQDTLQVEIGSLRQAESMIGSGLAFARRRLHGQPVWALAIDALDLAALQHALRPWSGAFSDWPDVLGGRVEQLLLAADHDLSLHAAEGRIKDLQVQMADPLPGIAGLSMELALDGDRLALDLTGGPTARWPHHIRADMVLDDLSGRLLLAPGSIEVQALAVASTVAHGTAHGWVYPRRPRPFLDLLIEVDRVGPLDPRPYLSYRTIPQPAMAWLDQSLVWVEQASGLVNLYLTAGTRARDLHPGTYQALVDFQGAQLDYWPGWPRADALDGRLAFVGNHLSGTLDRARFGAVELHAPKLEIADLSEPSMLIHLATEAVEAQPLASLLGRIPAPGWQAALRPLLWSGRLAAHAELLLPLRSLSDWQLSGDLRLDQTGLAYAQPALGLDALSGRIAFDRRGISPTPLRAELAEQVFDLELAARFEAPVSLALDARFNPIDLEAVRHALGSLGSGVQGASQWRFRLTGDEQPDGAGGLHFMLESDLQGLALNWPPPLDKPASSLWPSAARGSIGPERQSLEWELGERLAGRWVMAEGQWALTAGAPPLPDLPARGVWLGGHFGHLALGDWLAYLNHPPHGALNLEPEDFTIALQVDRMDWPGLRPAPARLLIERGSETWSGRIESPDLLGRLTAPIPLDSGRALVVDLERLYLERAAVSETGEWSPPESDVTSAFDPRGLPPFSIAVEDLRWGDLALGRARMEAHPVESGLEIEWVDIAGGDLRVQGSGRWVAAEAGPESRFLGRLTSSSLGALLRAAGYEAGIEAARAQLDLDALWPGAPQDFAFRRLTGALDVRLQNGEVAEARPGAGRLLGLASFNAIPRRLMLDFRDVFAAGLRFDEIEGRFALGGGLATTDGLVMRSTAAVITISGQTDMVARQYDQIVRVEPGIGATLPVIGGLAGGPMGAAAGLVLRQLFDRPLRGLAEARYQISGPWEAPEIELVAARLPDEPIDNDASRTPLP